MDGANVGELVGVLGGENVGTILAVIDGYAEHICWWLCW